MTRRPTISIVADDVAVSKMPRTIRQHNPELAGRKRWRTTTITSLKSSESEKRCADVAGAVHLGDERLVAFRVPFGGVHDRPCLVECATGNADHRCQPIP